MRRKKNKLPSLIFSKGLFFVLIILLVFFSISLLREVKHKKDIQAEIKNYETQLVDLDSENTQLQSLIDYLKTDEYAELEAKRKLGMKKEGEKVILVTEADKDYIEPITTNQEEPTNFNMWWKYFFK